MSDSNLHEYDTVEFKILLEFLKKAAIQRPSTNEKFIQILSGIHIKPSELSSLLSIPPQTINSALARMQKKGEIRWKKYKTVELDISRNDSIIHLQNHIHIVQDFLMQSLHLNKEEAYYESLKFAPNISCELAEKICERFHNDNCSGLVVPYAKCHEHFSENQEEET